MIRGGELLRYRPDGTRAIRVDFAPVALAAAFNTKYDRFAVSDLAERATTGNTGGGQHVRHMSNNAHLTLGCLTWEEQSPYIASVVKIRSLMHAELAADNTSFLFRRIKRKVRFPLIHERSVEGEVFDLAQETPRSRLA